MDWTGFSSAARARVASLRTSSTASTWRHHEEGPVEVLASIDAVLIPRCLGDDLLHTLSESERGAWITYLTADSEMWTQPHLVTNSIRALSLLGGALTQRPPFWAEFLTGRAQPAAWLAALDWQRPWESSKSVLGGPMCASLVAEPVWVDKLFAWLDEQLDPDSGLWPRAFHAAAPGDSKVRMQGIGAGAHIWPFYLLHRRPFPYAAALTRSLLAAQFPSGTWSANLGSYLNVDALSGLGFISDLPDASPATRATVRESAQRYVAWMAPRWSDWFAQRPPLHDILAASAAAGAARRWADAEGPGWHDTFQDQRMWQASAIPA